jgi:hypothetical protein
LAMSLAPPLIVFENCWQYCSHPRRR